MGRRRGQSRAQRFAQAAGVPDGGGLERAGAGRSAVRQAGSVTAQGAGGQAGGTLRGRDPCGVGGWICHVASKR